MITLENVLFKWHAKQSEPTINITKLDIDQGEHVFLHGPSGCGKSTLLSLLAGVTVPTQGNIELLGKAINQLSNSKRDRFRADHIGYIFQNFNLLPYLSPIENVTLGCQFSKQRQKNALKNSATIAAEASRLLSALGLNDNLQHQAVAKLSIGQQQRVAAARAFIGSPEIIIADEPTSALDTQNRQAFVKLLFEQASAANSTLIFVSHDETLQTLFTRSISLVELQGGTDATH
ncbi:MULTISPECIES: ABC transporter ATP-binding protein [Pseudoalteromonas]|uniref:ABC transporter ATP-binding protein n=1 Tax=Pseudoalteromonas shioyasakiensis TaxID=1190813 RepID=A0ABT6U1T5_9GAMM|nr:MULTISPECIES: ABC transporter ATP-binding protein [Pseudoalteromonas]MDI4669068.1 ABC transporter ATP-binding protein [Pseudoalteromonas shioyasakiensis]MDI4686236.1 ABC transporter ATP-binding protein [Pseudoalteromonas shioyasakiensis]MDI4704526.1 ABC transporter ATP-binding protein [Pseudoalteromonas shioyasakiensis]NUJ21970.1 ABC transporter ATP-binding protein [Pseudoalteromonas sp. 0802]NUJ31073.1 ABC transporter ATP-binding protein [Pseudoalteromonas sp. 2103]|tara:strand:+ start:2903 stop:3601 length:699 start_codon:yes stop_codon:yes gene_type:complete